MVSGSGLFRTSLKCSTHLSAFSRSVVSIWPCLFLSVLEDAGFFPARSLVILYNSLESPCTAAVSIVFENSPNGYSTNRVKSLFEIYKIDE